MVEMSEIRRWYHAEPFEPFVLQLDDGREVAVHDRDLIALSPMGRSVFVGQPSGGDHLVRLAHVQRISPLNAQATM